MLDNSALTIILIVLNTLWMFLLTWLAILVYHTFKVQDYYKSLAAEMFKRRQAEFNRQYGPPTPKKDPMDEANRIVNEWLAEPNR